MSQTIYQSRGNRNNDETLLKWQSYSSSHLSPIYEPCNEELGEEEEEKKEQKIPEGCLVKNELNEIDNSPNSLGINTNISYKKSFFSDFESKDFENYVKYKASPSYSSSTNKIIDFGAKLINTSGQDHITDLLIEKVRNHHYYLNLKNKKILDPLNYKNFREQNLNLLHLKVKGIKIFNKITKIYNITEKTYKISKIIMDEDKKNSHKVIEVGAEAGKIAGNKIFVKHYFMNSLRATKKGVNDFKKFYKSSKLIKGAKICLKGGSIGAGIIITLIADELIEGSCDLAAKGLKKAIDYFEDEK